MRSTYHRLLLSTCLSAMTFAVIIPVKAGFEWTPPEEIIQPVPAVIEESVMPPVVIPEPAPVVDEVPLVHDTPILEQESVIEEMHEDIIEPITSDELFIEVAPDEIIDEPVVTDVAEQENVFIEVAPEEVVDDTQLVVVEETVKTVEVIETPVEPKSNALTLNPFPVTENNMADNHDAVVLPSDEDVTIDDLNASDVIEPSAAVLEEKIIWNTPQSFDVIEGFGSDMPLALALSQIVPAQYAYSFGAGVNPGVSVSWDGGKPWNEVLTDALAPHGLSYTLKNQKIILNLNAPSNDAVELEDMGEASESEHEPVQIIEDEVGKDDVLKAVIEAEEKFTGKTAEIESPELEEEIIVEIEEELAPVVEATPILSNIHAQEEHISTPLDSISEDELKEMAVKQVAKPVISEDLVEIVKDPMAEQPPVNIEKKTIKDPGQHQGQQPDMTQEFESKILSDQKKNEVEIVLAEEISSEPVLITYDAVGEPLEMVAEPIAIQDEDVSVVDAAENNDENRLFVESILAEEVPEEILNVSEIEPIAEPISIISQEPEPVVVKPIEPIIPPHTYSNSPSKSVVLWEAKRGMSLYDVVQEWSAKENVKLVWNARPNYELESNILIKGTFENAIGVLFSKGLRNAPEFVVSEDGQYALNVKDNG